MPQITEDSIRILAFIYKFNRTDSHTMGKQSDFEESHIIRCIDFLYSDGLIERPSTRCDRSRHNLRCTAKGIRLIETPKESESRRQAMVNLNFNIDSIFRVNFESLLRADSIFRASLIG